MGSYLSNLYEDLDRCVEGMDEMSSIEWEHAHNKEMEIKEKISDAEDYDPNEIKRIVLIGNRGVGKTMLGKKLAESLRWNFYDLDEEIEIASKKSVLQLFAIGEDHFRTVESQTLEQVLVRDGVIALGGGTLDSEANRMALLYSASKVVWVVCSESVRATRLSTGNRPVVNDSGRDVFFRSLADKIVASDGKVSDICDVIFESQP